MRNWRVLTAIAAVVLAALAGVLVWKYTKNAESDAKKPYEFTDVLVAAKKIPANTSFQSALEAKLITREQRVRTDLPPTHVDGAPTDEQLSNEFKTLVAAHDIVEGQTIVAEDFVAQGKVQSGIAGTLETDSDKDKAKIDNAKYQAVTFTFDDQHAVGGFLQPGDSVNVIATMSVDKNHFVTGAHVKFSSFLLPGLKVIAVGSTTVTPTSSSSQTDNTTPTANQSRSLITFEVTPQQALQLIQAQQVGALTLSLNPPSFKKGEFTDPAEVVEAINLFGKPLTQVDKAVALAPAG